MTFEDYLAEITSGHPCQEDLFLEALTQCGTGLGPEEFGSQVAALRKFPGSQELLDAVRVRVLAAWFHYLLARGATGLLHHYGEALGIADWLPVFCELEGDFASDVYDQSEATELAMEELSVRLLAA